MFVAICCTVIYKSFLIPIYIVNAEVRWHEKATVKRPLLLCRDIPQNGNSFRLSPMFFLQ